MNGPFSPGRRSFLIGGTAFALAAVPAMPASGGARPKVPRTHGPSTRTLVALASDERPGTILISNSARTLDVVLNRSQAARYIIAIGREGFTWSGAVKVGQKAEWPEWHPPAEMLARDPDLPDMVPPGPLNPLGARALYLHRNGKDTLYRIHGTNDAGSIGGLATSGCFRLTNADILDLYARTALGTKVIVRD